MKLSISFFLVVAFACVIASHALSSRSLVLGTDQQQKPSETSSFGDCSDIIFELIECLPFVRNGSDVAAEEDEEAASGGCCDALKNVLKTRAAACVCAAFSDTSMFGVVVNATKAASLPSACGIDDPSSIETDCAVADSAVSFASATTYNAVTQYQPPSSSAQVPVSPSDLAPSPPPALAPVPAATHKKSSASANAIPVAVLLAAAALSFF